MHRALWIQEILYNITGHCDRRADLAHLARTCRTFKDPALDVLWDELPNMFPFRECILAETSPDESLGSQLTPTEWDNLRNYTRRIRHIYDIRKGLDERCLKILSNPPTPEPVFPNLRHLYCKYISDTMPLLHLRFPSLTSLEVKFDDPLWFQDALEQLLTSSPHISNLVLVPGWSNFSLNKLVSNCIREWQNLQTVTLGLISLGADALVHLSHMPALTKLELALSPTFQPSDSFIVFPSLHDLCVTAESLDTVSRFLFWIRLSTGANLSAIVEGRPSRQELFSFSDGVQACSVGHAIKCISLRQSLRSNAIFWEDFLLGLEDLQPYTAFRNLIHLNLDIQWNVGLADGDLLALASGWPTLERFEINWTWGWNSRGGITLVGLAQLLQLCPSLRWAELAINTQGYTELPSSESLASWRSTLPCRFYLTVLDSVIEEESVPAVAAFFAGIARCHHFSLSAWRPRIPADLEVYQNRWSDVGTRVLGEIRERSCT